MFEINIPIVKNYLYNINTLLNIKHDSNTFKVDLDYLKNLIKVNNPENFLKVLSQEDIQKYFEKLFNGVFDIKIINGVVLKFGSQLQYICDYCDDTLITKNYYYCYYCHKDMCDLCYKDNIFNSAEYCKENHFSEINSRKQSYYDFYVDCDICYYRILDSCFYSNQELDDTNEDDDSFDVCQDCYSIRDGEIPEIIYTSLKKITVPLPCNNCLFDSMLDWIPVLQDSEESLILINKNTLKYSIRVQDKSLYYGYYTINIELINEFINRMGPDSLLTDLLEEINLLSLCN